MDMAIEKVKALFPADIAELLTFQEQAGYVIIKPKQYLGAEFFANVARIIREAGGEYISAGKDSHFRIAMQQRDNHPAPAAGLHYIVTKLTVTLGNTVQHGEKEWTKQSYGLELDVGSNDVNIVERARLEAEQIVNSWLREPAMPSVDVPHVDIAELEKCPWTTYSDKKPASPGQAAWVRNPELTNWKDAPAVLFTLVKALNRLPDRKLVLGEMEYAFSGKDDVKDHFVSRKPVGRGK
jgi:hypothetical protein